MSATHEAGYRLLAAAGLSEPITATCMAALSKPGHLFSGTPVWSRLFLAWIEALASEPIGRFLDAAVACECMAAGYDLIDSANDPHLVLSPDAGTPVLPAGVTLLLLAQELMARADLPIERRVHASAALARGGRRALAAHARDHALRRLPAATPEAVLAVLRRRSGGLVAATCQCAALLAGVPWRVVAHAGCFGRALGCAAQLEDDLADRAEDAINGRKTVPIALTALYPTEPELVEATTWTLIHRYLVEAALVLTRLPIDPARTEALWNLLPPYLRPDWHC